ncbi:uncharacterized protein LOC122249025 [Penaeus japonicus]|uniref:uncharacterized protein LOC122249025 n=1 Tax=Penaeus japonicus TaxID=27405 RepID=UPI001C70CBF2|nr:uncharacterized protein LOC122249025 [Penaeus japonicus]
MKNKHPLFPLLLLEVLVLTGAGKAAGVGAPRDSYPAEPLPTPVALRSSEDAEDQSESGQTPLRCWECTSTTHGSECYDLENDVQNETSIAAFSRECAPEETFCSVERVWYVVEGGTEENNLSVNRTCSAQCSPFCLVMGDRNKIHSCITCCSDHLCNVGRSSGRRPATSPSLLAAALTLALGSLSTPGRKSFAWSARSLLASLLGFLLLTMSSSSSSSSLFPDL